MWVVHKALLVVSTLWCANLACVELSNILAPNPTLQINGAQPGVAILTKRFCASKLQHQELAVFVTETMERCEYHQTFDEEALLKPPESERPMGLQLPCLMRRTFLLECWLFNLCYPRTRKPSFWLSMLSEILALTGYLFSSVRAHWWFDICHCDVRPSELCCFIYLFCCRRPSPEKVCLCFLVHLAIACQCHMPCKNSCRIVSAMIPWALNMHGRRHKDLELIISSTKQMHVGK